MVAIYVAKGKRVSFHDDQPFPSPIVPKAKDVRFTYSDDEDEDSNA